MSIPPPIAAFPLVSDWLSFGRDGVVDVYSGRVELGQGISTALAQIAADELDVPVAGIRLTQGHTGVSPAEGPTVGSLSVTFGGQSVRMAASAARVLMLRHAAGLLQAEPGVLQVEDGVITKAGLDTGLSYAGLAADVAMAVPVVDFAAPKPASARRIAGTSEPRLDLLARIGAGHFVQDMELGGMLHGRVVQPPTLDAGLGPLDGTVCREGVDLVQVGRFVAVVSQDEYVVVREAERLAQALPWEPGSVGDVHPVDALAGEIAESEVIRAEGAVGDGDVSVSITRPVVSHASIGPSCAVARWDAGRLTVWAHSQNVFALRKALAAVLEVAAADVEVIFAPGAGCYGHNSSDDVALDAAVISRAMAGRPVRVVWSRRDEFQHAPLSPAMVTQVSARLDAQGQVAGYDALVTSPPHATRPVDEAEPNLRSAQFLPVAIPIGPGNDAPQPQGGADRNAIPGYDFAAVRVVRQRPSVVPYRRSAMRGLGAYCNVIAIEALMEKCAEKAGVDSTDYRLAHLSDPRARAVIEALRDMVGPMPACDGAGYGIGYARYKNSAGYLACVARVEVDDAVRVTDVWSAADVGEAINPDGVVNQIEGGIVQAVSWTLLEEIGFAGGQNLCRGWDDYPILSFSQMPRLQTQLIGPQDQPPLGAGEISGGPAGAAVVNAVGAVLGVTPDRLPLSRAALVTLLS